MFSAVSVLVHYSNKKALLRLSCESLKFRPVFDEILRDKELKKIKSDPNVGGSVELIYVLMYETLVGSGLNRCSPELKSVIARRIQKIKEVEAELQSHGNGIKSIKEAEEGLKKLEIPRYARINTLKWTSEEALKTLESEEWKVKGTASAEKFAEQVGAMGEDEIFIDPHVENLLIFAPNINNFHEYWMVEQRYLILQDKASCLPAFLLNPRPGSQVFDTCAAPGMKTSHAAAIMENQGKIWAMDRAADRVSTMKQLLDASKVAIASSFAGDFLKTDVTDKKFSKAMILKHALKLPGLKRAVYSTCSIHEEENEQVVDEVLLDTYVRENFVLKKSVLPEWTHRGLSTFEIGADCLRADPKITLTNGFFVAVFERVKNKV
uniref:SAM_MT_RSMB_NOP domain-containing protein n=1 Tax=Caenorhabditis japonica TaxID=281687 RepID=A0A8R1DR25_CAEJA